MTVIGALKLTPESDALGAMSAAIAARYQVVPLRIEDDVLVVAMEDPERVDVLDQLRVVLERRVRAERHPARLIAEAIREHYGLGADTLEKLVGERHVEIVSDVSGAAIDDMAADASIIKFVNQLIVDAYKSRATDIHLEPFERKLRVRYRIDGILFNANIPENVRHFREAIVSRIKIMANLDIAERRLPQDGRIQVRIAGEDFDLRVSVIPIAHGESVNLRILQRSSVLMGLESIGFTRDHLDTFAPLLAKPHGIILLTGPTGSGKTTTLYACLSSINETERKIITVEDPVEYQMEGICQMQARPDIGLSFAAGLRSMLRHDPDVMLIGEIRDFETAELAIRCALTGHLVFSTLHTNDAPGAMPRLIDIGVEPFLLASSIQAVVAQRLIRTNCEACSAPSSPDPAVVRHFNYPAKTQPSFRSGKGCDHCRGSGYRGRTAIHEILLIDDGVREAIVAKSPASVIRKHALAHGMTPLRQDGFVKAALGITTLEEVLRVTQEDR